MKTTHHYCPWAIVGVALAASCLTHCDMSRHGTERTKDDPASSLSRARDSVGRQERVYASQMLTGAENCLALAQAQREAGDIAEATRMEEATLLCYQHATSVAESVSKRRTLRFPGERVYGEVSVRPCDGGSGWTKLCEATGDVEIARNMMVQFGAAADFGDDDLSVLIVNGPGAVQYLSLGEASAFSDTGASRLPELIGLEDLSLYDTAVTDEGIQHLSRLPYLRHLNLMHTKVTSEGIRALLPLPALEELALGDTQVDDACLPEIAKCANLRVLLFRGVELSDVGIDHLCRLQHLTRLWLSGRQITDYGLALLNNMDTLEELVLFGTSATESGVHKLKENLNHCEVDTVYAERRSHGSLPLS